MLSRLRTVPDMKALLRREARRGKPMPKPEPPPAPMCATCKLWTVPAWDTGGFGTCYLPGARRDRKELPVLRATGERGAPAWVGTHGNFGCKFHEKRV